MNEQSSQVDTPEGRDWVHGLLKERNVVITFTKVNGEERVMTCTLNESTVPLASKVLGQGEAAPVKKENLEVCNVWDVNAKGWRSFRWSNVKKIEFSLGE
jgi:hypothetical protein